MTTEPTTCTRCGRTLRAPASIARGTGDVCAKRNAQDQAITASGIKADTAAKAREDIADGAVQPTTRTTSTGHRVYIAISSDGTDRYLTTRASCTCKAGLKGKHVCRHRAAAILLAA